MRRHGEFSLSVALRHDAGGNGVKREATTARLDARQQAEADAERDNALRLKAGLEVCGQVSE